MLERNWVILYVARAGGFFGFGATPNEAREQFIKAGGKAKNLRMTKVTHPEGTTPFLEGTTGSIQFPEGQNGKGTTYEELRLVNTLWLAAE